MDWLTKIILVFISSNMAINNCDQDIRGKMTSLQHSQQTNQQHEILASVNKTGSGYNDKICQLGQLDQYVRGESKYENIDVSRRPTLGRKFAWRDPYAPRPNKFPKREKPKIESRQTDSNDNVWFNALGASTLISLLPISLLFFVNIDNRAESDIRMKGLLALAAGGLLGDVFYHLIPEASQAQITSSRGHGHTHTHAGAVHNHDLTVSTWVLVGYGTFWIVEMVLHVISREDSHDEGGGHVHYRPRVRAPEVLRPIPEGSENARLAGGDSPGRRAHGDHGVGEAEGLRCCGILNLTADFLHNFMDGLAIGATFLAGQGLGNVTTLTVLLHEVPHEIGDYVILINCGFSKNKAICMQLFTASGAILGTLVSLMVGGIGQAATSRILAFAAGSFIYIACVAVIPQLSKNRTMSIVCLQIAAFVLGVFMMVVVAYFE